jgi:transcriptional regulator with XRE-family HTH domain
MNSHDVAAGKLLRQYRLRRGLTLHVAARLLSTSAPVLSRKERGQERIERRDIAAAVRAYELSSWDAYRLWTASGLIPEPSLASEDGVDLPALAETLLPNLPFPAFFMDILGYVLAWNEGIETIWRLSASTQPRIHAIGELFSERVRAQYDDRWDSFLDGALAVFYQKSLPVANDPAFDEVIKYLARIGGPAFTERWRRLAGEGDTLGAFAALNAATAVATYDSPAGPISYLVLQSGVQTQLRSDLYVYVPYGEENNERYRLLQKLIGPNRLYLRL